MRWWLVMLAACGGGSGGTLDAEVTLAGATTTFAAGCELRPTPPFQRAFANAGGNRSIEIVWREEVIDAGDYEVSGSVIDDVVVYFEDPSLEVVKSPAGAVTFTTLDPASLVEGTFELLDDEIDLAASGSFSCR